MAIWHQRGVTRAEVESAAKRIKRLKAERDANTGKEALDRRTLKYTEDIIRIAGKAFLERVAK